MFDTSTAPEAQPLKTSEPAQKETGQAQPHAAKTPSKATARHVFKDFASI